MKSWIRSTILVKNNNEVNEVFIKAYLYFPIPFF